MPIAIITGGNSGIGKATAVAFAARGYDVGITWHEDTENLADLLQECRTLGIRAEAAQMDLDTADPREVPARAEPVGALIDRLGGVDVFVNNAGAGHDTPFLETDFERFLRVLDIDLVGAFCCLQTAARRMVRQNRGGRLIAVTSVHEHVPLEGSTAYVTAKHGLGGLVKSMALELAAHAITVNAVAPGEIATKMTGQEDEDPSGTERHGIPAGRPGRAEEIAAAITWLSEPNARYTTGHSLVVDGGMLLMRAMANQLAGD
jgi:NAD(P)-dependent dehydrogenase (short-subunit alcohol dehydrogenase family)